MGEVTDSPTTTCLIALYIAGVAICVFIAGKSLLEEGTQDSVNELLATGGFILIWPAVVLMVAAIWCLLWLYDLSQRWR